MGVRGFAPSMVGGPCRPRPASKIITPNREPWFFGTNSGSVYEPLMWEVRFFVGNGEGIETLAKPIFVRAQPFNGWHAPCLAGAPCALFIQNHCAKSGNWGFSERTLEACTNLSWEVRFLRERGGDRSIGGANLRKGQCPFNGSGTAAPRPPRTICCFAGLQKGRVRPAKGAPVF